MLVGGAQTSRQAWRKWTKIHSVFSVLDLPQRQPTRERIEPRTVRSKTQPEVDHPFWSKETLHQRTLHAVGKPSLRHARLQLKQDLPIVLRTRNSLKKRRRKLGRVTNCKHVKSDVVVTTFER